MNTSALAALFGLEGQVALVTGANRGLGRSLAMELSVAGARVVVAARSPDSAAGVVADITASGGEAATVALDVADEGSVERGLAEAAEKFGQLDLLVNNAGFFPETKLLETSAATWDEIERVNLRGAFLCLREAAKLMHARGAGGTIVNISSMGAIRPAAPDRFAYNAVKAGLNRLTEDAASALAVDRIRVNAVLPGPIDTASDEERDSRRALHDAVARLVPLGRWATPREIAAAVIFLASPAGAFVTGQQIVVDGGFTVGRFNFGKQS